MGQPPARRAYRRLHDNDENVTNGTVAGPLNATGRSWPQRSCRSSTSRAFPTIPPGPIILTVAAAVVVFGPWPRSHVVGLVAALFVSVGGVIATIAGSGFGQTLGAPSDVGAFTGALVQIVGLLIAVPAGLVAARRRSRSHG